MRDILSTLLEWQTSGRRFALACVTRTWGSSPRPLGSLMGVREDGLIVGSVSGGCVETAVIEEAQTALTYGGAREMTFDRLAEGSVWQVGLSCGGKIQVWIDPEPEIARWAELLAQDRGFVLATTLSPVARSVWKAGDPVLTELDQACQTAYEKRESGEAEVAGARTFLHAVRPRERLLVVGAVHIAAALVKFAKDLGFETVVIDPRATFAAVERFPIAPDLLVNDWPQRALPEIGVNEETYAVVLTHDPKIDDVALAHFLRSPAAYIGALGSRTTQAQRRESLAAEGFSAEDLARIHGPVGLAIGAKSPEEIAISILAEIIQVRNRS